MAAAHHAISPAEVAPAIVARAEPIEAREVLPQRERQLAPVEAAPLHDAAPADRELARCVPRSLNAEIDDEFLGRSKDDLLALSGYLPPGGPPFDPALVARVIGAARRMAAIPASRLAIDLVRWVALPLLVLAPVLLLHFPK
jgi:hypothetical protein